MKWQSEMILFVVCLNLATGIVIELNAPGTAYVMPSPTTNATDYEGHFNASEVASGWTLDPTFGSGILGDIWSGFNLFLRMIEYVVIGFPLFLTQMGHSFITDAGALAAWNIISAALVALWSVLMVMYFAWLISGREI